MNKRQLANAFAAGKPGACHNARVLGDEYRLHNNVIAKHLGERRYQFNWCGWYTPTTASHMNELLRAIGVPMRVSYAEARDTKVASFIVAA